MGFLTLRLGEYYEMLSYPSKLVERAVEQLATLPGIGRKSALRLALHLLSRPEGDTHAFAHALVEMRDGIIYCRQCHNISDTELCSICANPSRDASTVCVVQHVGDVLAIENTGQYRGLYHVLGGVISPIDGIGPEELLIDELVERVHSGAVKEVILALGTTSGGGIPRTSFIYRRLQSLDVKVSVIARGIAIGVRSSIQTR